MTAFWVLMQRRQDQKVYADLHKVRGVDGADGVYYLTKEGADAALAALPAEESDWWHVVPLVGELADVDRPLPLRPFMTREQGGDRIDEDMAEDSCALIVFARTPIEAASMCMGFHASHDPEEWARPLTARDVEQIHEWLMHYVSLVERMRRERDEATKALAALEAGRLWVMEGLRTSAVRAGEPTDAEMDAAGAVDKRPLAAGEVNDLCREVKALREAQGGDGKRIPYEVIAERLVESRKALSALAAIITGTDDDGHDIEELELESIMALARQVRGRAMGNPND